MNSASKRINNVSQRRSSFNSSDDCITVFVNSERKGHRCVRRAMEKNSRIQFECDLDESAVRQQINLSKLLTYSPCPEKNCSQCKASSQITALHNQTQQKRNLKKECGTPIRKTSFPMATEKSCFTIVNAQNHDKKYSVPRKSSYKKRQIEIDFGARPDPEGASSPSPSNSKSFDISSYGIVPELSHTLIFSDYDSCCTSDSESDFGQRFFIENDKFDESSAIIRGLAAANLNSSTLINYAIISTEITNIVKQNLFKAEHEISSIAQRIRMLDSKLEATEARLKETREILEETNASVHNCESWTTHSTHFLDI